MIDLANETALITGASRGIGAEIAKTFGMCGCKVAVNYLQNERAAEKTISAVEEVGGKALAFQADVREEEQVNRMVESVSTKLGQPTILINNASSPIISKKLGKTDWSEFILCFETAIKSAFNCASAISPLMRKQRRGKIINIISQYVFNVPPIAMATYITSKHALVGFSKSLAVELAPFGVQVNMISPGLTETDLTSHLSETIIQASAQSTLMKRNAQTSDTAGTALYLASDLSNHLTGVNIPVCGGNVM